MAAAAAAWSILWLPPALCETESWHFACRRYVSNFGRVRKFVTAGSVYNKLSTRYIIYTFRWDAVTTWKKWIYGRKKLSGFNRM
jgi:hypothetical protein